MTGDIYPAAEMHQWGVVNRIQARADQRLLQTARDHGVTAADNAPEERKSVRLGTQS
jgi:enoyl-CoA hydratase/carnithine racemase